MVVFEETIWNNTELKRIAEDIRELLAKTLRREGYEDFEVRLADFYATISYPLPAGEP